MDFESDAIEAMLNIKGLAKKFPDGDYHTLDFSVKLGIFLVLRDILRVLALTGDLE